MKMKEHDDSDLNWREESPLSWVRSLDATERNYIGMRNAYMHHGREWGMIVAILKLDALPSNAVTTTATTVTATPGPDDNDGGGDITSFVAAATQAWKWIRHSHPILASTLNNDETKRMYTVATQPGELESWLAETLVVHDSAAESAEKLRLQLSPVRRAVLHLLPRTRELMFQLPHHLIDGHSLIRLCDRLLRLLAGEQPPEEQKLELDREPEFGDETKRLAPAPHVATQMPDAVTPAQLARAHAAIAHWMASMPSVGVVAAESDMRAPPGNTHMQRMVLSAPTTAAVLAAAKTHGLTATHVVEAAVIIAARQLERKLELARGEKQEQEQERERNYCSFGLFSLREWCQESADADATIPYVSFLPQVLVIRPATDLVDMAAQVKQYYAGLKAEPREFLALVEPTLAVFAAMGWSDAEMPPNQNISVSSMGRFEPRLESVYPHRHRHGQDEPDGVLFRVEDFVLVYEIPDPSISSFSWTRCGQLQWTVCYNEAYHRHGDIAEWVSLTRRALLNGLGVSDDA